MFHFYFRKFHGYSKELYINIVTPAYFECFGQTKKSANFVAFRTLDCCLSNLPFKQSTRRSMVPSFENFEAVETLDATV